MADSAGRTDIFSIDLDGAPPARRRARRWPPAAALALAATAVLLAATACGRDQVSTAPARSGTVVAGGDATRPAPVQHLEIDGTEYAFGVRPTEGLHAGWTRVTFRNRGSEAHQVMFASLKPGVDLAALAAAAGGDSSGSAAIEFVDMLGGVSYIGPGQSIEAMVQLREGVVLAMCYVPDRNGVAHALSGMSTTLTVGPPVTAGEGPSERLAGTIAMTPDGYRLPAELPTGWYRVVNEDGGGPGEGLHELAILGLGAPLDGPGRDRLLSDLAANVTPSVELAALGGMGALSGGLEGYLYLDLPPGPYLAVDFMPDPGSPRPHLLDGYVAWFDA